MPQELDEFNKKFNLKELKIYETKFWILSLKRECSALSELEQ